MDPTIAELYVITTRPSTGNNRHYTSTMLQHDMENTAGSPLYLFQCWSLGIFFSSGSLFIPVLASDGVVKGEENTGVVLILHSGDTVLVHHC